MYRNLKTKDNNSKLFSYIYIEFAHYLYSHNTHKKALAND